MVSLSPGQKIEFDALVTKTYFSKFGNSFKVTDGSYEFSLSSSGSFSSGDVLHIIAVVEDVAEFKLKDEASKKY
ncbi:MAG: hypothetical protein Q7S22_06720, partial [Candidatus Micrarchaeota archaeon]|nr:hypothetical protein [Candidatus Micrarchaeota archaeon]